MGRDLPEVTQANDPGDSPGTGSCRRSRRGARPRWALCLLPSCRQIQPVHQHPPPPAPIKRTVSFSLFPSWGLTRFSLLSRSLCMSFSLPTLYLPRPFLSVREHLAGPSSGKPPRHSCHPHFGRPIGELIPQGHGLLLMCVSPTRR